MPDDRLLPVLLFFSQMFDIGWNCGGFRNYVFIFPANIASYKSGCIFCMESREKLNFITVLCSLTSNCQYDFQSVFFSCASVSSQSWPVLFKLCSKFMISGIDLWFPSLIKPEVCNIWLIILTIFFDIPVALAMANSACFTCASQSVKNISLKVSLIFGRLEFLPSS